MKTEDSDIKQDKKLYFSDELQQRSAVYLRKSVYENINIKMRYIRIT